MYKQFTLNKANNPGFWSDHWNKQDIDQQMLSAKKSELMPLFKKYLPKDGRLLEAGCGQGIFVNALKELAYKIEGIDFDVQTVEQIKKNFPELNINVGDVFDLKFPDNYFSGYISLGVIEHYENDWQKPVIEARRVLDNEGIIFLAVPHLNYSRMIVNFFVGLFNKPRGEFYQYFFRPNEIAHAVESNGFELIGVDYYGKSKTLMSLPILGKFFRNQYNKLKTGINQAEDDKKIVPVKRDSIKRFIFDMLPNKWFAHMVVIIAKK